MKFTVSYLSDLPGNKTLCIHVDDSASKSRRGRFTQVARFFLAEPILPSRTMITVVVKGAELPVPLIEKLATECLLCSREYSNLYHFDMDELQAPAV